MTVIETEAGKVFAQRLADIAAKMGFAFAYESDREVITALEGMRPALARDFGEIMDSAAAAEAADAFVSAVIGEKHRLEVAAAGRA